MDFFCRGKKILLDKGLKIQHSGSTPFILNEVEGLTTSGSTALTTGGSMSLTTCRTSKVRGSAGSLAGEYTSLWLTARRGTTFKQIIDQINQVTEIDYAIAISISSR